MLPTPGTAAAFAHQGAGPAINAPVIPFDYAASFAITGRPGNIAQDVVNISPDGVFVATAIAYGFEEERGRGVEVAPARAGQIPALPLTIPGDITLGQLPVSALLEGVRINPAMRPLFFATDAGPGALFSAAGINGLSDQPLPAAAGQGVLAAGDRGLFQRVKPPEEITFLFSIIDSGTGRELQDEPVHNIASLGKSDGERPFRQLAAPVAFAPRSSIRVQIIERSEGVRGTLQVVFHGYRVLGSSVCPEPVMRMLQGPPQCPTESIGGPDERVLPFDHVATFALTGHPQNVIEREIGLSTEGGFVVTSLGYGLLIEDEGVPLLWNRIPEIVDAALRARLEAVEPDPDSTLAAERNPAVNLGEVPLRLLPPTAWLDGIRIRPEMVRLALDSNGRLASALPADLAAKVFERLNQPASVSFRYAIFDGGRGRDLQNRPLHNIAGLGIANGDRPFKRLARALVFLPRATLRVTVEEFFGRGTLFMTFQGYKLLGPHRHRGRRLP